MNQQDFETKIFLLAEQTGCYTIPKSNGVIEYQPNLLKFANAVIDGLQNEVLK